MDGLYGVSLVQRARYRRPVLVVVISLPFLPLWCTIEMPHPRLDQGTDWGFRNPRGIVDSSYPGRCCPKGADKNQSCWVQRVFKILRPAAFGEDGVEVDPVHTWIMDRRFCAQRHSP